jgi:3-methylcrotonyl-CoA carboxylase alpha subunit
LHLLRTSRNFIPDAGRLLHLKTPRTSDSVRIDAGFVEGDEISSHYDPMIAKLIVGASTREEALRKMEVALQDYEVVGVATNIEFLKRVCGHPDFVAGEVETGFIDKHREELFEREFLGDEVFAQAALALLLQDVASHQSSRRTTGMLSDSLTGLGAGFQHRRISLVEVLAGGSEVDLVEVSVSIHQIGPSRFNVAVKDSHYEDITSTFDPDTHTVTTFYPHTRLATTLIRSDGDSLSLFQQGKHHRLQLTRPAWHSKALGIAPITNSVLAPMPCKILRVDIKEGDTVTKDQALVVIESMKMETVIRSPQDGVVKRVVHAAGDMCKAGTALVEFMETEGQQAEDQKA